MGELINWIQYTKEDKGYQRNTSQNEDYIKDKQTPSNKADKDGLLILISADYDPEEKKTFLKFYDIKKKNIAVLYDKLGHKPYAFSKENIEKLKNNEHILRISKRLVGLEEVVKHDPITDSDIHVTKIIVEDPLVIGGTAASLRNHIKLWEADIKYYANYLFDSNLNVGKHYLYTNGWVKEVEVEHEEPVRKYIKKYSSEPLLVEWIKLLSEEVPEYRMLAVDIEVYVPDQTRMPQPENPRDPIFVFSLRGTDGLKKVLIYNLREEKIDKEGINEFSIEEFKDERELISRAMEIMRKYPIIVTFNGDNFDMRYIRRRAEYINFRETVKDIRLGRNDARIDWGVHIDLYRFFKNVSIKNYAFSGKYDEITLNGIGKSLVSLEKIELDKSFDEMTLREICIYSFRDAEITFRLANFNNQLVMKLITIIGRIANMTLDDVCRLSVSNWIRNRMIDLHRKKNYIIPLQEEIKNKGGERHFEPVTKGKKYKGAIVVSPKSGVHFNVYVLDIASLYPSIMKEYNISYETVNCPHPECRGNLVKGTKTYICKKQKGIVSEFVGLIRDIRVNIFKKLAKDKSLSKDKREFFNVVQNTLKVFINAIYGVFGSEEFFLFYLPAAEAVTTLGRHAIEESISEAENLGLEVIYGDTDSFFIKDPRQEAIEALIKKVSKKLKLQLEIDKIYRYVVFSQRKKNYFGVLSDGTLDVKGLVGKKSSTPEYIKRVFYRILEELRHITTQEEFEKAKKKITNIIMEAEEKLRKRDVDIEDLALAVTLTKPLKSYTKTTPQHVKAARLIELSTGRKILPGSVIKYVKTVDQNGVKPMELIRNRKEIDANKYIELLWSTLTQIVDVLEIERVATAKSRRLDQYFL